MSAGARDDPEGRAPAGVDRGSGIDGGDGRRVIRSSPRAGSVAAAMLFPDESGSTGGFLPPRTVVPPPGGGGQLTVVRAGNGRPLRKVPAPGNAGSGGSPTGESPSSGAETTQPGGTGMTSRRRVHRDMVKRPTPREQALTDGMNGFRDRRGERAVECCLKPNGAYYHHLAAPAGNRRGVRRSMRRVAWSWLTSSLTP